MIRYLILFMLLPTVSLSAQPNNQRKLEVSLERLRLAMIDADSIQLGKLVSEQLSYGHSSGQIDNKKLFIEKLTSGKSDFVNMTISDQQINLSSKTAVVRHILQADILDSGTAGKVNLYVMQIWQKKKGQWLLLARQAVKRI